ncbi:hypothetical protein GCM10027059_19370 [Myceligenerans halotolerans]
MPTYAYRCTECDHAFDIHQAFTDDALTACPECSGRLRKVFGSIGVTFKGSGFYRNDSRGSSKSSAPASNGSPSKESSSTGSGSNGSKTGGSSSSGASTSSSSSSTTSTAAKAAPA